MPAGGADSDASLAADVRRELAQLGLRAGGGDDAFSDFAPEKARQRIGGGKKGANGKEKQQGQREQQQGKDKPAGSKDADRRQSSGRQQDGKGQQQRDKPWRDQPQQQQRDKPWRDKPQQQQRGKPWRDDQPQQCGGNRWGAGADGGDDGEAAPAPKIPNAKSILPKDEPTIWHEAAGTLPALPAPRAEAAPHLVEQKRKQAERLLLVEEQVGRARRLMDCCGHGHVLCASTGGGRSPSPGSRLPPGRHWGAAPCSACRLMHVDGAACLLCPCCLPACLLACLPACLPAPHHHGASTPGRVARRPTLRRGRRCRNDPLGSVEAPTAQLSVHSMQSGGSQNATPGPALPGGGPQESHISLSLSQSATPTFSLASVAARTPLLPATACAGAVQPCLLPAMQRCLLCTALSPPPPPRTLHTLSPGLRAEHGAAQRRRRQVAAAGPSQRYHDRQGGGDVGAGSGRRGGKPGRARRPAGHVRQAGR